MSSNSLLYLNNEAVSKALKDKWKTLVPLIEKGFRSLAEGKIIQPLRLEVDVDKFNGGMNAMPAFDSDSDILVIKILTFYPDNPKKKLPVVQSVALLYDVTNGSLKAAMDAHIITNMRTAAASLVATKYLANKDSKCVAILGSGNQGHSHYEATKQFYDIKKFRVWDVDEELGKKFVEEIKGDGYECELCKNVQEAVKDADIIHVVCLTETPIVEKKWVKEGAHINSIGANQATSQELATDLMLSAVVYADDTEAIMKESGDVIISQAEVYADLGEVVAGKKEAFPAKTTIFKSGGIAMEDIIAVNLAYENYCKQNKQ